MVDFKIMRAAAAYLRKIAAGEVEPSAFGSAIAAKGMEEAIALLDDHVKELFKKNAELFKKDAEIAELKISGKKAGRYIYHYCAAIGRNSTFSGIAQMENRIISQADLEHLKNLVSTSEYTASAILSLSYLGREFGEPA